MKVTVSAWSCAFTVMMSSLAAHLGRENIGAILKTTEDKTAEDKERTKQRPQFSA